MSLYSDLVEILTPYANKIKGLAASDDQIKADLDDNVNNLKSALDQAIEDFAVPTQEAVDNWLDRHPEATTTVQDGSLTEEKFSNALKLKTIKDYVTPEMFGAVGDGVANDYNAFYDCAHYANEHNVCIFVPHGNYYINGDSTIELHCNFVCDNAVFLIGDNHEKLTLPVFAYSHDAESNQSNVLLSTVVTDNDTVTDSYSDKFFVLDTKIAYGTASSGSAPSDETIKETCFTNGTKTKIYFDTVDGHLSSAVDVVGISDMNEKGYLFAGAVIKQSVENSYGICFLEVRRNNMTIKDIQIECNNALGEGTVIYALYCNNLTIDNVKSYSKQPNTWTYEISANYCANLIINNLKGFNEWSTAAHRGLKNYTLSNSVTNTFDCHWNAYGDFVCENCFLYADAHIGYGKGMFIVRDTTCDCVKVRRDFVQTWSGKVIVENVNTKTGFHIDINSDAPSGYDSFFNTLYMPEVRLIRLYGKENQGYIRVPDNVLSRIATGNIFIIDDTKITKFNVPYNNVIFKCILKNVPYTQDSRTSIKKFCEIVSDDNVSESDAISSVTGFDSVTCVISKSGNIVSLSFSGIATDAISSWTKLFEIPGKYKPDGIIYCACSKGESSGAIEIKYDKGVKTLTQINANTRLSFNATYIVSSIY